MKKIIKINSMLKKLNEKKRYVFDSDIGIPYKIIKQIGATSKYILENPEGEEVEMDIFGFRRIKELKYKEALKEYFEHEKFMKDRLDMAKEDENEENNYDK